MTDAEQAEIQGRTVLIFDGVCGFCHRAVRFLLRRDLAARLLFLPMESLLGREVLARVGIPEPPESVVLITAALTTQQRVTLQTEAFAGALQVVGGLWGVAGSALRRVPRFLRDPAYRLLARFRYRIFGKYPSCPLPLPAERARYLGL